MRRTKFWAAALSSILPSRIRILVLRHLLGATIGRGVRIGFGSVLIADEMHIGPGAVIGRRCRIRVQRLAIGPESTIGDEVKISVHSLVAGARVTIARRVDIEGDHTDHRSSLVMGMYCWIFSYCYLNVVRPISFGRNVGVGGGSYLFTHGLWLSKLDGYPVSYGPISMGDDVWIPWSCFVMPGVSVGSGAVVGARSLLIRDVPPGALAAGTPARILREVMADHLDANGVEESLLELSEDFATKHGLSMRVEKTDRFVTLDYSNGSRLRIHRHSPPLEDLLAGDLNIAMGQVDDRHFCERPILRLTDSLSSRYSMFNESARRWLGHSRVIGIRFYPVDELAWTPYWDRDGATP